MYEESDGKEEHLVLVMLKGAPGLAFHGPPIPPFFFGDTDSKLMGNIHSGNCCVEGGTGRK